MTRLFQPDGQSKGPQVGEGRSWEPRCRDTVTLGRGGVQAWHCGLNMADVRQLHRKERKWAHADITGTVGPTSQVSKEYLSLKNESVTTWQCKSLQVTVFGFPALALNPERLGRIRRAGHFRGELYIVAF